MRTRLLLLATCVAVGCADAPADTSAASPNPAADSTMVQAPPAESVVLVLASLPMEGLWPGFSPASIPVALFDGDRTLLVGHPAPPNDFLPVDGNDQVRVYPGRHPAVRGHMPTEIDGVRVAAVLLNDLRGATPEEAAAVVTHERFHVHQLQRHPSWTANELALFQYPSTDAQQLFDRRLETLALHRSMEAPTPAQSECWLRTALLLRRKRMAQLPPDVAEFERSLERHEGLARYVQRRAAGVRTPVEVPPSGFAPEEVRARAYVTGEAIAVMLDRYARGWKDTMEAADDDPPALDSLLWAALLGRPATSCGFSAAERADVLERANDAVDVTRSQRIETLRDFEAQQGWTVRVISERQPLWPQSFDPMNMTRVGSARLVHDRMLRAGNEQGSIDVFDRRALSTGYLDDPLGSGIREVLVTGLAERPVVTSLENGGVRIVGAGVEASFAVAHVTEMGQELVVRLR